jgi:hypothetical protein
MAPVRAFSARAAFCATLLCAPAALAAASQRADTTVVTLGRPVHPGVATLVPELTFGRGVDAEHYRFTYPTVYLGRSSVYIADATVMNRSSIVREYDRVGNFRRNIGRPGQGPGEYTYAVGSVRELPDGRILLSDQEGILEFSPDGRFLKRWATRSAASLIGSAIYVDPAGYVLTPVNTGPGQVHISVCPDTPPALMRFRLDGTAVGTEPPPFATVRNPSLMMCNHRVPFVPTYGWQLSPLGYFVTSYNATYAVDFPIAATRPGFRATGAPWRATDPVVSIRRTSPRVPVLPAERQDYRDAITRHIRRLRTTPPGWQWNGPEIPSSKPPTRGVRVASDGRLWVFLHQPAVRDPAIRGGAGGQLAVVEVPQRWAEARVFDVIEPQGRYIGQVRFPPNVRGFEIAGDTVWAVSLDSNDAPSIVRYRVAWVR